MGTLALKHRPFDTFEGVKGIEVNIDELRKKLEASGITGILVGGCIDASKPFPRKDIDVVFSSSVDSNEMEGYDAWLHHGDRTENIRGVTAYNSLGTLALALGNLSPGLHVLTNYHPNVRQNLPVTSAVSIADIAKGEGRDLLDRYRGKPVAFSFQGRQYVGRFVRSDMWLAEFDDLVDIDEQELGREGDIDKAVENAQWVAKQFLGKELTNLERILERHVEAELQARNDKSLEPNSVIVHYGEKRYDLDSILSLSGQYGIDSVIPRSLTQKYDERTLKGRILDAIGKPYYTSKDSNEVIQLAKKQVANKIFYHGKEVIPFFSVKTEDQLESYRNPNFWGIDIPFNPSRKITIDGQEMLITIDVGERLVLSEEIKTKMIDIRNRLIDYTFLSPDSHDFFRQYNLLHQRNLLPFFDKYMGNYSFARQAIINLTDSAPLIRS